MRRIAILLGRLWLRTLRVRWPEGEFTPRPCVIALWHEDLPACMAAFRRRGIAVLVSASADGEIAARICTSLGYRVFRGSTSRLGLSGTRALLRELRRHQSDQPANSLTDSPPQMPMAGMALDGPRGPRRVVQPGAARLAELLGVPVVRVTVKYGAHLRLGSWDRMALALPFARVHVFLNSPFP